jgi:hypothetical protein
LQQAGQPEGKAWEFYLQAERELKTAAANGKDSSHRTPDKTQKDTPNIIESNSLPARCRLGIRPTRTTTNYGSDCWI